MGAATEHHDDVTRIRPRRIRFLTAAVMVSVIVVAAACAPPPPPNQVANPDRTQVVAETHGADRGADLLDVPYLEDAYLGCGAGSASHDPCNGSQTLDVRLHTGDGPARGTIVFVHGGGFTGGDKSDPTGLSGPILAQLGRGWDVVSVNYRLNRGDLAPWPAAVDDVAAAVAWVRGHGAEVGLGTTRIVTAGHSAGGTLATLVALAANSDDPAYNGSDAVDGWIDIAGINDFSTVHGGFWGSLWSAELEQLSARLSPIRFVDAQDPPGYVIHGDDDGLVPASHSLALKDEADRRGARVSLDVVDAWSDRAWMPDRFRNHVPTGGVNVDALNRFLDGI